MFENQKLSEKTNKGIVIASAVLLVGLKVWTEVTPPTYFHAQRATTLGLIAFLISPFFVLWIQKLWNAVIPQVTGWRKISFVEAMGIVALAIMLN